ncbi:DUF4037 domain-containing protein [Pseudonocardia sp. TRM90224]|uniref:DUF4037 domain-containing protein n=1 Tax=Pseudonocardia sp. TRM90224 TaxID=2812678 RepID=UPI001E5E1D62|nr:DUF4037 domain-containing protein [Pseudonocardia sp. TRM90224]
MFLPGLELSRAFYAEAVAPLLDGLVHTAARVGSGSEVLGFDTERSADHEWGPRLQVFLSPTDAGRAAEISTMLAERLPRTFRGWSTHFAETDDPGIGHMSTTDGPVDHRVEITDLGSWLVSRLAFDPRAGIDLLDWLATPTQALTEVTAGAVFHDGLGELEPVRAALRWYPPDVWRHALACQWARIAEEEAFVGRCGEVGDELGSAVVAARLTRDLIRLCLLIAREYPPYSKWLGSAFARIPVATTLTPHLRATLAATDWPARETHLAAAYETVARLQNTTRLPDGTPLCADVDPATRPYHSRPFQVIMAGRFTDALRAAITDPEVQALPLTGTADQHLDNTNLLTKPDHVRKRWRQ